MWLRLTDEDNRKILVNLDEVLYIVPDVSESLLFGWNGDEEPLRVQESLENIWTRMNAPRPGTGSITTSSE